jgi:putative transposase
MDELERQESRGIRESFKYKLKPTPEQERALGFVVRRCRELYNAALQERKEAWEKCRVGVTLAGQSAQLPAIKVVRAECRDIHSQVLQDVLARLDRAFQAFFRRVKTVSSPAIHASKARTAIIRSPTSHSAMGPRSTTAPWC